MTQEHPITPPPELVQEWINKHYGGKVHRDLGGVERTIATQAARWGAAQELEACCEWIADNSLHHADSDLLKDLRTARRPKPPSLKEQALLQLDTLNADLAMHGMGCDLSQIRRALESLPD